MNAVMQALAIPLNALMGLCYQLLGNYVLAIIGFTVLTKIILLPVSLWMQRNSIRMVELMPELNDLKIKYYGDKETIAEETQALYKRRHYHQFASMLPMVIQLVLLVGVIEAVRVLLEGSESVLSGYPAQEGGIALLMPLAAGAAALLLGLAQNRFNPLQREQGRAEQWMTNGLSILISLVLGTFVPLGVGVYWIASNLLTIGQQMLLNAVIDPKKYVDYEALHQSKAELAKINSLSSHVSKEDKQREKADYKRFFSIANKHLVFYSESSGFYKYFQNIIEALLARSNVVIHYITSDPKDQIFRVAQEQPRIKPYYIGEKRLITLMMKMDADIVVMTMPDLENYHIKRSYVRKDVEYIYVFHGVISGLRTLRPGALDHFDTLLSVGDYLDREVRMVEERNHTKEKRLVPCGYGVVDNMAAAYAAIEEKEDEDPYVLIAPSWQESNILESCLIPLCQQILGVGYRVIVRPHPQYLRRFPQKFEQIMQECAKLPADRFEMQTDFSSNDTVFRAALLVTDWSSIGYEYALATRKPVLFINTPMKVVNPQIAEMEKNYESFDLQMRKVMGASLELDEVAKQAGQTAKRLIAEQDRYREDIQGVREQHVYNFGTSGLHGAHYIISALKSRKESKV